MFLLGMLSVPTFARERRGGGSRGGRGGSAEVADHEVALDIDFRMVVAPVGMIPGRGERRRQ